MAASMFLALATPLITDLVSKHLGSFFQGDAGEADRVKDALVRLSNKGFLHIPTEGAITDGIIRLVNDAVKQFQQSLGLNDTTGLLDPNLLEDILQKGCQGILQSVNPWSKPAFTPPDNDLRRVRYYVEEQTLPAKIEGHKPIEMIREAWSEWVQYILVNVMEVDDASKCNVRVFGTTMDGPGGDLADAHKGPPDMTKNELRFDSSEEWTADKFRYAAVHEMGHILGLDHTDLPGHIMSVRRQDGPGKPTTGGQDSDISRLLALQDGYWKPRPDPSPLLPELQRLVTSGKTLPDGLV